MKIVADLHIHSKYSRATSPEMNLYSLSKYAKMKGLNLLGTGDFTHPDQIVDMKRLLKKDSETGFYIHNGMNFIPSTEVSLIYTQNSKGYRVHHCIVSPDIETAEQITEWLKTRGRVDYDGRPIFKIPSPEFVEKVMEINRDNFIFPAHIWTPWFSMFGSESGFNTANECFGDQIKHIHAIETGLSSDPAMNWRLSQLDRFACLSNSDCHYPWPNRLGREANVFELNKPTWKNILNAIKTKNKKEFLYTIEVDPFYGKYHYDGHRACNICLSPKESIAQKNICPKCSKGLTIGVEHRVEELADRPIGFVPKDAIPFKTIIPLQDIISAIYQTAVGTKTVKKVFDILMQKFPNELHILLDASEEELSQCVDHRLAKAILLNRANKITVKPGYDGEYGVPEFSKEITIGKPSKQKSLGEF
jgi:uncharacterized protein (TIGR00375 family)